MNLSDGWIEHPDKKIDVVFEDFFGRVIRLNSDFQAYYIKKYGSVPHGFERFFSYQFDLSSGDLSLTRGGGIPGISGITLPDTNPQISSRFESLCNAFNLTGLEQDILILALFPRLSDYHARIPDSGFNSGVSFNLLKDLTAQRQSDYKLLQKYLYRSAPLCLYRILQCISSDNGISGNPAYAVTDDVWNFLCGHDSLLTFDNPFIRWSEANSLHESQSILWGDIHRLCLNDELPKAPIIALCGDNIHDQESMLVGALAQGNRKLLCVNIESYDSLSPVQQEQSMADIVREAILSKSALLFEDFDIEPKNERIVISIIEKYISDIRLPVFLIGTSSSKIPSFHKMPCVLLQVKKISAAEKMRALLALWPVEEERGLVTSLLGLTERYYFSPGEIPLLLREADLHRQIRDVSSSLSPEDLQRALVFRTRKNFGKLAQRIIPAYSLNDIALSTELHKELEEIIASIKLRNRVSEEFFKEGKSRDKGISILFHGDSGTGKTMAAEVIASSLGADLIKIDLSTVIDKYIGETEKNLARIFDLAQNDSGVLFFDEADALFGKRSDTKSSNDRHANIEVSYLLQRLENHPGPVILATNNRNHLDPAFTRRFTFVTRLTYPKFNQRLRIWRNAWPGYLALSDDIDFESLAAREELTGACIRNVAFLATVLAIHEGSDAIHYRHIESAVKREMAKSGRLSL